MQEGSGPEAVSTAAGTAAESSRGPRKRGQGLGPDGVTEGDRVARGRTEREVFELIVSEASVE